MIEILMVVFYLGKVEVVMSAERMYGVKTLAECQAIIPEVRSRMADGHLIESMECVKGDIINPIGRS